MVAWLCSEECDQNGEIMAAICRRLCSGCSISSPKAHNSIRQNRFRLKWFVTRWARSATCLNVKPYFGMMGNVVEKLREMGRIK